MHQNNQGLQLSVQIKTFVRPRCLPILFDEFINSPEVRIINFYQMMVFGAVRTIIYLRTSDMCRTIHANIPFLLGCIDSAITYAYKIIHDRLKKNQSGRQCTAVASFLRRKTATWLGWQAFQDVFLKDSIFAELTDSLVQHTKKGDKQAASLKNLVARACHDIQVERLLGKKT